MDKRWRVPFSKDTKTELEKAVYRLQLLGVFESYTIDHDDNNTGKFVISAGTFERERLIQNYIEYIKSYQSDAEYLKTSLSSLLADVQGIDEDRDFIINVIEHLLKECTYKVIEKDVEVYQQKNLKNGLYLGDSTYDKYGFDYEGYDGYGHDIKGFNRQGMTKDGSKFDAAGYDRMSFDKNGFDFSGRDREGYDRKGYDEKGFDRNGYNKNGFNQYGESNTGEKISGTVYHNIFGAGEVVDCRKGYLDVLFSGKEVVSFVLPESIGEYVFIEKPDNIIRRENLLGNAAYKAEDRFERIHYEDIRDRYIALEKSAREESDSWSYVSNDFSDSFDADLFKKQASANALLSKYIKLVNSLFFARIDWKERSHIYIGKQEIPGEVIDWADPICSLYYEYQMYAGNKDYNLSLVRDIEISDRTYIGFEDKLNTALDLYAKEGTDDLIITDPHLIKVIEANKTSKRVHDIIATIQANQYKIITTNAYANVLVEGCAGSGKTMILFHRLRYILRNNKEIDYSRVIVISPTSLLITESTDLLSTLQIEKIQRFATYDFYVSIIAEVYKRNKAINNLQHHTVTANSEISDDFVRLQYSASGVKKTEQFVTDIILNTNGKKNEYVAIEESCLLEQVNLYVGREYAVLDEAIDPHDDYFGSLELYRLALQELNNISNDNLREIIKGLNSRIEQHKKGLKVDGKKSEKAYTSEEEAKDLNHVEIAEWLLLNEYANGNTKYTKKGFALIDINSIKSTIKLFGKMRWRGGARRSKMSHTTTVDPMKFMQKYRCLMEQIEAFISFRDTPEDMRYLFEIVQYAINNEKKHHAISVEETYEYEGFVHVHMATAVFGKLTDSVTLFFIDEFQDYSVNELKLLTTIFPNAIFNYYGDCKQCINPKGIIDANMLHIASGWERYSINENYRNGREITEYVNQRFNMSMMPIGTKAIVRHAKRSLRIFEKPENGNRTALIVSHDIPEKIINCRDLFFIVHGQEIDRDKINVFSVALTKGLEFERVYVIPDGLSQNEQYVAYTRALNELIIIDEV